MVLHDHGLGYQLVYPFVVKDNGKHSLSRNLDERGVADGKDYTNPRERPKRMGSVMECK